MSEKNFALTPSVSIARSKFDRTSSHKTSIFLGDIVPIYVDEVLPGDTRSLDYASLIRMSTPIAPIMDDIEMELFAFFVPNRLVWNNWKKFMGESDQAGISTYTGTIPKNYAFNASNLGPRSLGNYMGLPYSANGQLSVNELPLRAYWLIYNRWFRNQNVEAPKVISLGDTPNGGISYLNNPAVAQKKADYFTRALPYAQKGQAVTIPLGTIAPIIAGSNLHSLGLNQGATIFQNVSLGSASGSMITSTASGNTTLVADLSTATAATINQLREAFQMQKALEKDALYGTRYWELLYAHFGVTAPDASLQDPEYLGGARIHINIEQVLQTTGYAPGTTSELGTPGANSVTGNRGNLFTKSFVEHGYLMVMAVARQSKHSYTQGLNRMWSRSQRFDFYFPVFANLGAQEIKNKELYFTGTASTDDALFGYQEAWAEYRYKPSIVSGILNPVRTGSLNFWTLADAYGSLPTLSNSFLQETRDNLGRALVSGTNGPDFICDFYFKDTAVRPMPLYSIPGLIDHH